MPELPEAEVVARQIRDRLSGATLTDTWIGRTDIVREGFRQRAWYCGAVLRSAERFGKSVAMGSSVWAPLKLGAVSPSARLVEVEIGLTANEGQGASRPW